MSGIDREKTDCRLSPAGLGKTEKDMRHIVLQGERGAGKSYLIRKLVQETGLVPGGYLTRAVFNAREGYREVLMYPASCLLESGDQDEAARWYGRVCGIALRGGGRVFPEVFAGYGKELLESAGDKKIIVMDEIGFMETDIKPFTEAVLSVFAGDIPVIAAIKARDITTPFLDAVRRHEKTELIELAEGSRDEAYRLAKGRLAERIRAGGGRR